MPRWQAAGVSLALAACGKYNLECIHIPLVVAFLGCFDTAIH
jgi:hypothetical protein